MHSFFLIARKGVHVETDLDYISTHFNESNTYNQKSDQTFYISGTGLLPFVEIKT